ncbi:HET-domain-containing protein [Apiospora arundinis]|uniref:HET-domain-containing protein n=1 Tax=Apiospora arundinis TaxID=335852 RepID=A0ABR2IIN4_9PEZI
MSKTTPKKIKPPDLFDAIFRNLRKSAETLGGGKFLPEETLGLLLTEANVYAAFKAQDVKPAPDLVKFALSHGKRVFLTLLWGERLKLLEELHKAGFGDDDLPVDTHPVSDEDDVPGVSSLNKKTWTLDSAPLPAFADWNNRSINCFVDNQWLFLVAKFPGYDVATFASQHPLPLISIESEGKKRSSSGGFSDVFKLELCGNFRRDNDGDSSQDESQIVAVKRFNENLVDYFFQESDVLKTVADMHHRHLIEPIAMFQRGIHHCVIFPWASGGNLSEFWVRHDAELRETESRASLVSWSLDQMIGISDALRLLHHKNGRHGDLKPENILHFEGERGRGRLVVADFGLSKFHIQETYIRTKPSSDWSRTSRYEPPEVDEYHKGLPRSRHYDLWPMGCIFLEFAIWLVHGLDYLKDLNQFKKINKFWVCETSDEPEVHPLVLEEMDKILKHSKANSATKDIVQLVKDRLLLVKYDDGHTTEEDVVRASAEELYSSMIEIRQRASGSTNYLSGQRIAPRTGMTNLVVREKSHKRKDSGIHLPNDEKGQPKDPAIPSILVRAATLDFGQDSEPSAPSSHPQTYRMEQTIDLNDRWVSSNDNDFAKALFRRAQWVPLAPPTTANSVRCADCSQIDFLSPQLAIPFDQEQLQRKADDCGICAVIHEALSCLGWTNLHGTILRANSEFRVAPNDSFRGDPLVLSMYADPRTAKPDVEETAQLGYPDLPGTDSSQQYEIMRAWRDTCDHQHKECYPWKSEKTLPPMPTRVIDVGTEPDHVLRIVATASPKQLKAKYVALSHCWGNLKDNEKFCTTKDTIDSVKSHIPFDRLPKTFRDAVTVTRKLGVRYLWIDSICIIQGDTADWEREAQKMGDVFRFAYCTLAASSAESSIMGFTGDPTGRKPRARRKVATLTTPGGSQLYLCRSIDNFRDHVEGSILASRGWVFQERALSRRTLHFTSTQLYWECGKGVHCETLGKLHNAKAALMGDAQFPESVLQYFRGGRIIHFQHLYQMYSKLAFTHWSDRAVALLGLESRLGATFKTRAEFGLLEEYLQRSLLWKRAKTCLGLARIPQPKDVCVPSWSWMAYQGAIGYLDVPPKKTDWLWGKMNIDNPFEGNKSLRQKQQQQSDGAKVIRLKAVACDISVADRVNWNKSVIMDDGSSGFSDIGSLKCVVLGQEIGDEDAKASRLQHVLIVKAVSQGVRDHYQRVGAGSLLREWVQETEKTDITLV